MHYEQFSDGNVKCIEDEIPFDLPDGWAWCRLGELFNVCSAKRILKSEWKAEGIPFYRAREIVKLAEVGSVDNELYISKEHYERLKCEYGVPQPGDLMISGVGTIGKVYIVSNADCFYYKDASVLCFENRSGIVIPEFAKYLLESDFLQSQMKANSKGTTVDTITISTALNYICILPPPSEQKHIVCAIANTLSYVKKVQDNKTQLFNVIAQTKSKILDLAIRGKLVPQDPNDEPASVLLERIRTEKEKLIEQGKIKRNKRESVIFRGEDNSYYQIDNESTSNIDDDLPFDIPNSWCWGRLKDIVIINPRNKIDDDIEVSFIPMSLINDGYSGSHTMEVSKWKNIKTGFTHFMEGDIAVAKITPCFENRKSAILKNLCNGYGAGTTELHILRPYKGTVLPQYLLAFVKSEHFIENGKQTFSGAVGQQRISKEYVENSYFPIPPIEEQNRIVHQISTIFELLNLITDVLL